MGKVSAGKPMRDAILAALTSDVSIKRGGKSVKAKRLAVIADMLVTLAAEGNLAAIREICDRIDGKATQGRIRRNCWRRLIWPERVGDWPAAQVCQSELMAP